ncbi:sensor histidine kinase [Caenimonas aquaedulcis]|uniref:histidine kinase n=1 Tax=Caenimonas aquaedulcis TaxID=2793270 RepID=A0A931H4W6_9BURK|nr:ATP-binding protein [Caenimonas aquaedulcis]MBG9388631.1 ATP-binding protein [Caenimonas aquaedulcis]
MAGGRRIRITLASRLAGVVVLLVAAAVALATFLLRWLPREPWLAAGIALAVMLPVAVIAVRAVLQPVLAMFRALGGTVISYRDGDFSFGLHWERDDEIGDLVASHNALGDVLREQRVQLVQRELLLDTMVQNTPVAMLLVQEGGPVVFANIAARQLLHRGRRIEGVDIAAVLQRAFPSLREAYARGGDGLFSVSRVAGDGEEGGAEDEIYHLARREFTLNGRKHELLLLRHLTAELRRQEVQTWKKVIRVISHELNNSLAPVASLASSSAQLLQRGQTERLPDILRTIEDRARHLERFIEGYAKFAKLPAPRMERVAWRNFIEALQSQVPFRVQGELPGEPGTFDAAQMEQALINLLKNAHESGSAPDEVCVCVRRAGDMTAIEVADRGSGMAAAVMEQALVPFYSTKRSGTGLGLALAREIAEAHHGRIGMHNRPGGGLAVTLVLPASPAHP